MQALNLASKKENSKIKEKIRLQVFYCFHFPTGKGKTTLYQIVELSSVNYIISNLNKWDFYIQNSNVSYFLAASQQPNGN